MKSEAFKLEENWLTTHQLISYVKKKHNRHWNRLYIYTLLSRKCFDRKKLGHINIYNTADIDRYINTLKRSSSSGVAGREYEFNRT